mmetsp:Transcript_18585/g.19345  ORF Transcript_18585/g.19345 Transcript_18585/m.19345 type:complete len:85 (+) Transcript_18585:60-314(+)
MSTKIKDVIRALRPEKLAEYASDVIVRQRHDLRTHPKGAQRFIFKVMFAAQLAYYSVMFVGWNHHLINKKRAVIKKALDDAHIH